MLPEPLTREWLQTNGIGGFSCSTVSGANTRRYHGLLTAATVPPAVRYLLLSKVEETLVVGGERFELSTNIYPGNVYPGVINPSGFAFLAGYRAEPFPEFTFLAGGVTVQKRVSMVQGENTVSIEYECDVAGCSLELRPLIAFRGYHELTHSNEALNGAVEEKPGSVSIAPYEGLPRLYFLHDAVNVRRVGEWYFNFEYPVEQERGLDFHEDLYCPFVLECGASARLVISTVETPGRPMITDVSPFVVRRGAGHTIIAGYPWFTDWGRDTMIALPGLTLCAGKFDIARGILVECSKYIDQGMLPNRFPDSGERPEYNTVDATLWYFEAIRKYVAYSGDDSLVNELRDQLQEIIDWHVRGTRYGIRMDDDGLLMAGDADTQLTWMDARVGGRPVTARNGKAVEVQALWFNALKFMGSDALASKAAENFNALFWNEAAGCLFDVVGGDAKDDSLRPNQLIALSLGFCAIPEARARRILKVVEEHLLTPYGLRTLAPSDSRYQGRYDGPPESRDAAYHQGTVWPWLLGPFLSADIRFNGDVARTRAAELLAKFEGNLIPEIYDGDAPHAARGCFAQAWSVGEIARVRAEDLKI
jgi:glycogen debranching enzyme